MAASPAPLSEISDGPVLTFINKRIRNLKKKLNRITQIESKPVQNIEQQDLIASKPSIIAAVEELEKIKPSISLLVDEEIDLALKTKKNDDVSKKEDDVSKNGGEGGGDVSNGESVIEDLLKVIYIGSMFNVKSESDYKNVMLTRTHERACCLSHDYVTDDDNDVMLNEFDLDLLGKLSELLVARPVDSGLCHESAIEKCVEVAKNWVKKSESVIDESSNVTYAALREKLTKIIGSMYLKITPEMKASADVAAEAAGNYVFQVPAEVESSFVQLEVKEDDSTGFQTNEAYENQSSPVEDHPKDETEAGNSLETPVQMDPVDTQADSADKDQYVQRRFYPNQRGGGRSNGGGRSGGRGFGNGRGGRSGGRGGPYQNGRGQYNDQQGNYYPRNNHGGRGRGGRGNGGYGGYNNHASGAEVAQS